MRNNLRLYHMFIRQLCQWLPNERITRKRNLALLVTGLYLGRGIHLPLIVRKWPMVGRVPSLVNRLHRFLDNPRLNPQACYQPLVEQLLKVFTGRTLRLAIDTTKVGFGHRALVVGLAYRKRTLPLAWSVHPGPIGNVAVIKIIALLEWVHRLVPSNCEVVLTGDAAFRMSDLLYWLREHHWHYVIRQRKESLVRYPDGCWFRISTIPIQPGQTKVIGWVWLARTNPFGLTWLVIHWAKGEKEPWILVSDYGNAKQVVRTYRLRMWIEEMFGDMKKHGFDLERTMLRHFDRLSRLTLAVALLYVWLISVGTRTIRDGLRNMVDRNERRDLSIFQIGLRFIERCVINAHIFQVTLCSYR